MASLATPLHVCVLIPCYNDEAGLLQALQSICYHPGLCLAVIVDDGSQKPLNAASLQSAVGANLPLQVIRLAQNKGITAALNTGLQWILQNTTAPYIARLDCRDTCAAERFYLQVDYLNKHPAIGLLGSWCVFEEAQTGISYQYTTPVGHPAIVKAMHLRNVFIHPTVMFRAALVRQVGLYPEAYPHAEDYAFFWKLLQNTRGAIIERFLVTCAINRSGLSYRNKQAQLRSRKKVILHHSSELWIKMFGVIKIYCFMLIPKALLLRLKSMRK